MQDAKTKKGFIILGLSIQKTNSFWPSEADVRRVESISPSFTEATRLPSILHKRPGHDTMDKNFQQSWKKLLVDLQFNSAEPTGKPSQQTDLHRPSPFH